MEREMERAPSSSSNEDRLLKFDLSRQKLSKTLDIGSNGTSASADALGRILQLSGFHPEHGIIVAAPYEQFDGSRYYDPAYVREYRARMLRMIDAGEPGFGLRFETSPKHVCIDICRSNYALVRFQLQEHIWVTVTLCIQEDGELVQSSVISSSSSTTVNVRYTFNLSLSVHRASYGQLTEGGPIPIPDPANRLAKMHERNSFAIVNPNLKGHVEVWLERDARPIETAFEEREQPDKGPVTISVPGSIDIPPNASATLTMRVRFLPNMDLGGNFPPLRVSASEMASGARRPWRFKDSNAMFIVRRNLDYILGNCAIPVSDAAVCLITDHVALPLGWNRDNYWQIRFLVDAYKNLDRLAHEDAALKYRTTILKTLKGHLDWVFRRAQRPMGFWHRSYLVTGKPKDGPVFQLDQQCYPLLELCVFLEEFPKERGFVQAVLEEETVSQVIELLQSKRDTETGLYPTDETPGDDAVELPFHFSSHVLLWHTISRLAQLVKVIGPTSHLEGEKLQALADDIHHVTMRHFFTVFPTDDRPIIAYLSDGRGQRTFYHDANDLPTLFAFYWKFLHSSAALKAWRNTMDFALSTENENGYFPGHPFGGLGSVHTRGPWPLGYLQEFAYAMITGNSTAERDAWRRIQGAMLWDGLFSEAVDCNTGECTSKAWFSWPGSVIGSQLLSADSKVDYFEVAGDT